MKAPKPQILIECPCGSGKSVARCCGAFFDALKITKPNKKTNTLLFEWMEKYSTPIIETFFQKTAPYVYRLSEYLGTIKDSYSYLDFPIEVKKQELATQDFFALKNNFVNSYLASYSCLAQGLFLQHGIILRAAIEDCLVILDIVLSKKSLGEYVAGKYDTKGILNKVKGSIPGFIEDLYSYYTANFVHFGPFHRAFFVPAKCYPDHWILYTGINSLAWTLATYHIVLERVYFDYVVSPFFWSRNRDTGKLIFDDDCSILKWLEDLRVELESDLKPGEKQEGFIYDERDFRAKTKKR